MKQRWQRLLPGLWAGLLLCIAFVATPAPFAALAPADAGRVVSRIFVQEAWLSLALAALLLMLERGARSQHTPTSGQHKFASNAMLWGTVACTLLGYFLVQMLMPAARAGQGTPSFAQLHMISMVFFSLKLLLVLTLAWRATVAGAPVNPRPSS
jgi:hypothetical protein